MLKKYSYWVPPVILVMIYLLASMPVFAHATENQTITQMIQAIEQTGAEPTVIEMRTTVDLGMVDTTKDLTEAEISWSKRLNFSEKPKLMMEDSRYIYVTEENMGGITCVLRLIGVPQNDKFHTYVVVGLKGKRIHAQDMEKFRDQITALFKKASRIPQFSTCIRGIYSDKLSVDQQEDKIHEVLAALQANEIERLQDETVLSISAYTELWNPAITTGQHKMNLQVATHLDSLDSITRITVGTPIITAEY
ncbi:YwmB family TATA-box binding protein [Brevibacillus ginsengisoli]|uniref:YwmB family TATA-box binding protein n=1 Tax=Brevibacillus ginsengisoli TaxID=363854 RepID=UPI003CEC8F9D